MFKNNLKTSKVMQRKVHIRMRKDRIEMTKVGKIIKININREKWMRDNYVDL